MQTSDEIFAFGEFRLDVKERRIWRGHALVTLPPKTFDLLVIMVKDAGRLLDKDYLIRSVWPDSYVQDANLSVHVANIRKALGKSAEAVPFIETVPKAGYRFVVPVSRLPLQVDSIAHIEPVPPEPGHEALEILPPETVEQPLQIPSVASPRRTRVPRRWLAALTMASMAVIFAVFLVRIKASTEHFSPSAATTHPLISTPGLFLQPAFSPDGSQLAYTWYSGKDQNQSIYVQNISEDRRSLLVDTGRDDYAPAWSPTGDRIAFLHTGSVAQTFEVLVVNRREPSQPRRIATICDASDAFHGMPSLSWSPDGKSLLTTDCTKTGNATLTVISVANGARVRLTNPPARALDDQAVYSPDGAWIAFRRSEGDWSDDIYLIPSAGGAVRKITTQSNPIDGLAWSADGNRIIFSSAHATSQGSIWSLPLNGGVPVAVTTPLTHTSSPAVSPAGHRMAYVNSPNNVSVWKLSLTGRHESQPFIASNFFDSSAVYSPDGTQVAFRSDRSGSNEIWLSHSDGSEPRRITHFGGPMTGSPCWSPDGKSLAFDSRVGGHADIYVANLETGNIRRITTTTGSDTENVVPNWSADGAALYFSSNRTGSWQIWRHVIADGTETQITSNGGFNAIESADGKYLIYVGDMDSTEIRIRSLADPQDDRRLIALGSGLWHSWGLTRDSLLYLTRPSGSASAELSKLDLHSGRREEIASIPQAVNDILSISSDKKSLLHARRSSSGSSIMIVDGWR
ncbi:winged helix-turn-helix domain-containing protein [Silvibacterium acidisoli]|uniref:winged helix-turn-helix domain-containing protein n=1 Tax=Acidobacteriaceae bacterium ZG23-2 TaxID=2883246 RepID=UPI00406C6ACC